MSNMHGPIIEKLKSGDAVVKASRGVSRMHLRQSTLKEMQALGPTPLACLRAFVDLGLSDAEIAAYFGISNSCVTKLCEIWGVRQQLRAIQEEQQCLHVSGC